MEEEVKNAPKKNGFKTVLKKIFVDNIGWKLAAIAFAILAWAIAAGL